MRVNSYEISESRLKKIAEPETEDPLEWIKGSSRDLYRVKDFDVDKSIDNDDEHETATHNSSHAIFNHPLRKYDSKSSSTEDVRDGPSKRPTMYLQSLLQTRSAKTLPSDSGDLAIQEMDQPDPSLPIMQKPASNFMKSLILSSNENNYSNNADASKDGVMMKQQGSVDRIAMASKIPMPSSSPAMSRANALRNSSTLSMRSSSSHNSLNASSKHGL
jgi:hypothetical protein